jgi:hypothetical protein
MMRLRGTAFSGLALCIAIACGPGEATAGEDMAGYFASYHRQQAVGRATAGHSSFCQTPSRRITARIGCCGPP